jgi:hypothetical protein
MGKWRPSYIAEHLSLMKNTQAHENRTFSYFKEAKPLSKLPLIRKNFKSSAFSIAKLATNKFFEYASQYPPRGLFYYSVVAFDELGPTLQQDLYPLEPFISLPETIKQKLLAEGKGTGVDPRDSARFRSTTVWFGPSGATTQAHYDVQDNFYAQLYGHKRFILFPPEQNRDLYLNGFLHSAAQQAQVDLEHPDLDKYPRFKNAAALDAFLEPGDVLFLPALWFHHVIALDLSFSVSIWSKNEETMHMWEAEKEVPPIRTSWSASKLALAGYTYMKRLIQASLVDLPDLPEGGKLDDYDFLRSPTSLLADIWDQRYKHLIKEIPELSRANLEDSNLYCNLEVRQNSKSTEERLSADELSAIIKAADHVASLMLKVKSHGTRAIWLGNYCEHIALGVTQLTHMIPYLQSLVECQ